MNAYGHEPGIGRESAHGKERFGSPSLQIQKEWNSHDSEKKKKKGSGENIYLIPVAIAETIVMLGLVAMNYCFRFDPSARDSSSLADYSNLDLSYYDLLRRPYYNYSLSHEENQNVNISGGTFGISFGMPEYAFFVTAFTFPLLVILSVELGKSFTNSGKAVKLVDSLGIKFPGPARRILRFYFVYLLFGSMAGMMTSFIKLLFPQPRPHFRRVCNGISPAFTYPELIEDCPNQKQDEIWEALRSFPSYHATIAVYGGAFLCLYMFYTMKCRGYYTINVMLSLPIFVMAAIATLHRWATYHSYFRDIVWGGFIGLLMALYAVYGMLNRFKERSSAVLPVLAASGHPTTPIAQSLLPSPPPPPPAPTQVHRNPAFIDDEPIGNHFVRAPRIAKAPTPPETHTVSFPGFEDTPAPPAPTMLPRVPQQQQPPAGPGGRPAQAFNSSFALDTNYPQHQPQQSRLADYNTPRQRYSVPPPPQEPSIPRPASAYPHSAHHPAPPPRSRSRYEGASYF